MRSKAFTLVELLVVISVIALLLSVLMPAMQKAKLLAEEVVCRSNLRQYVLAGSMYLTDNSDTFPNAWESIFKLDTTSGFGSNNTQCQWHNEAKHPDKRPDLKGVLWDYIGGFSKVHYCPTFARIARSCEPHVGHVDSIPIVPLFCYSMNAFLGVGKDAYAGAPEVVVKSTQVKRTAETFFFAEENCWPAEIDPTLPPWVSNERYKDTLNDCALCGAPQLPGKKAAWEYPREQGPPYLDAFGSFHKTTSSRVNDGQADAVFLDGHVGLVKPERTYYHTRPFDRAPASTIR